VDGQTSAVAFIFCRTMAEISSAANTFSSPLTLTATLGLPFLLMILNGRRRLSRWTSSSLKFRPIKRLISKRVLEGLMVAWFFAASPINLCLSRFVYSLTLFRSRFIQQVNSSQRIRGNAGVSNILYVPYLSPSSVNATYDGVIRFP